MKVLLFSKTFRDWTINRLGAFAKEIGADGLDLAVRAGYPVNPENVRTQLPKAVQMVREMGLTVDLVTTETRWTDPESPQMRELFHCCGRVGIPFIKIGYWVWGEGDDYWCAVARLKEKIRCFERLSRETGVATVLHTHSGNCYGSTAHSAVDLIRDTDPRWVGIYLDPAHLAIGGERPQMALAIIGDRLKLVAAKNVFYRRLDDGHWSPVWCQLNEGLVDWTEFVRRLVQVSFGGPISLHAEYSAPASEDEHQTRVRRDASHLRQAIALGKEAIKTAS